MHFSLFSSSSKKHNLEGSESPSPNPNSKLKSLQKQKSSKENAPPSDLNSLLPPSPASSKIKSPLPSRPPNPLKHKLAIDTLPENVMVGVPDSTLPPLTVYGVDSSVSSLDSVRMRPVNKEEEEGEMIVQKVGNDALEINGQTFTFDSFLTLIRQLVGLPLIENCLAGFNSSVVAYGEWKDLYAMWGLANAL
ncbi:hypothetical protein Pint_26706 [Pistacia integerrima]|uniref:Uncharacterized protein n=1 Tax=Pistacia integerrima TaxID=434235 RepID=A0ACC0YR37_9ROSI|nr:hypothetical protein Pint_26706 [Pistacia integerrima]